MTAINQRAHIIKYGIGLAGFGLLFLLFKTFILVNATWSLPEWGWFRVPVLLAGDDFKRGDKVEFPLPVAAAFTSVKVIYGLEGQTITTQGQDVFLDGKYVATAKTHSLKGRPLTITKGGVIPKGKAFVLGSHRDSYDSRYEEIGFIPLASVISKAYALPDIPLIGLDGPILKEGSIK